MNIQNYIISNLKQFPKIKLYFRNFIRKYNFILNYSSINKNTYNLDKDIIKEYNSSREFGYQKYLCHAPFSSIYFNTNGDVVACCKNTQDVYGNLMERDLLEIWNSMIKTKLQDNIIKNNLDYGCQFCKNQLISKNYSGVHARIHDQAFFFTKNNFPAEITLEISNVCNLECIMCSGEYSSLIRKNREVLPPIINKYPTNFVNQLKPFLKAAKIVRLQGGEPFLINDYLLILEYLGVENEKCKIYIQTNGTIFNKRVEKILEKKQIHLSISMDSLDENNLETIRKNLNFKQFRNNLKIFKSISEKNRNKLNINFCLMKNNWKEIPDLFEFCNLNSFSLNIIPLDYPIVNSLEHLKFNEIDEIIVFLKTKVSESNKLKFQIIFDGLLNSLENAKEISLEREKITIALLEWGVEGLYLKLKEDLSFKNLNPESIQKIIHHIDFRLKNRKIDIQRLLLAKSILNNKFIEGVNFMNENLDAKFTQKIIEYFDYELSLLN